MFKTVADTAAKVYNAAKELAFVAYGTGLLLGAFWVVGGVMILPGILLGIAGIGPIVALTFTFVWTCVFIRQLMIWDLI